MPQRQRDSGRREGESKTRRGEGSIMTKAYVTHKEKEERRRETV